MKASWLALALTGFAGCSAASPEASSSATPATPSPTPTTAVDTEMQQPLERIARRAGGVVGVAVHHVETGRHASVRGDERFPMASVYKVPIAICYLRRVADGRASLDTPVRITAADLRPGASPLAARFDGPTEVKPPELLRLMLAQSDNTASDLVLGLAGGPAAVSSCLDELGHGQIDVSRTEGETMLDFWGVPPGDRPPPGETTLATFSRLRNEAGAAQRKKAIETFVDDPRDTTTPQAMAHLLARLQAGELLAAEPTRLLLDSMAAATTGPNRIRAGVPKGAPVGDKTGSGPDVGGLSCCTNDVGIVTLPDGSHFAIAVFVKASPDSPAARERVIAELTRAAWELYSRKTG